MESFGVKVTYPNINVIISSGDVKVKEFHTKFIIGNYYKLIDEEFINFNYEMKIAFRKYPTQQCLNIKSSNTSNVFYVEFDNTPCKNHNDRDWSYNTNQFEDVTTTCQEKAEKLKNPDFEQFNEVEF